MTRKRPRVQHQDSGASLILALGFVLMVSLIVGGLVGLASTGLSNRNTLQVVRDRQYAADAAIMQAIAVARSTASSPTPCTPVPLTSTAYPKLSPSGVAIRVDWVNSCPTVPSSDGSTFPQRNVTFSAFCGDTTDVKCNFTDAIIRAQVNFEPAAGTVTKTYVQSWSVNR
jgi:hypothetical protein